MIEDMNARTQRFLLRVALRRLDLAAEIYHLREPQKIPLVMSQDETRRLLAVASSLKVRVLLSLGYGCGLRAGCPSVVMVSACQHPKTCTQGDIGTLGDQAAHPKRSFTHPVGEKGRTQRVEALS
jgi:hypothetical protein